MLSRACQVGSILQRALAGAGHQVVVLSRSPQPEEVFWDGQTLGPWARELEGAGAVINLAGRSVNCRYNGENRRAILESRLASTAVIGRAIAACTDPPPVWLQASTATIYAHRYDAANDEHRGILGGNEPVVMAVHGDREHALSALLPNDILIELRHDLAWRGDAREELFARAAPFAFLVEDRLAKLDALQLPALLLLPRKTRQVPMMILPGFAGSRMYGV